jgi:prepilin peptidase dependent protein B
MLGSLMRHLKTLSLKHGRRVVTMARGLTLVELLVATTVGLFVVSGISQVMLHALATQKQAASTLQVTQQLRAAADVMQRDMRRAGHWQAASQGVALAPRANVYQSVTPTPTDGRSTHVGYAYSRDEDGEDDRINAGGGRNERFGFDVVDGVLRSRVGGAFQALTDPGTVVVSALHATPRVVEISLGRACAAHGRSPCCRPHPDDAALCVADRIERTADGPVPTTGVRPAADMIVHAACPVLVKRRMDLQLEGHAAPTRSAQQAQGPTATPPPDVVQTIIQSVQLRNDELRTGACP